MKTELVAMSIKYSESPKLSADYLRQALPLMSKLGVAVNPNNYAVFYSYVANKNSELKHELSRLLESGERFTRAQIEQLFRKYFSQFDPETVEKFQHRTRRILAQIIKAIVTADNETSNYSSALDEFSSQLGDEPDEQTLQKIIEGVIKDTRFMRSSYEILQNQLSASTKEVDKLRKELMRARRQARVDPLTGLENRAGFVAAMEEALAEAGNTANLPCLLMIDIDHFKKVNDTFGHLFGDNVLKLVGVILQKSVKGKDTASRYGGEEFAILLPDTPLEGARLLAETIRTTIGNGKIQKTGCEETVGNIFVSIGVAGYHPGESVTDFIERADAALYRSKNDGRNRVTLAD